MQYINDLPLQQLYLDTETQVSRGDDTDFVVEFNKTYTCRTIKLNKFSMPNLISNFGLYQTDFSIMIGAVTTTITISQIHLDLDQFITYINSIQGVIVFTYTTNVNKAIITLTGNVAHKLIGDGWKKLGFITPTSTTSALSHTADTYYNLQQTPCIYVRFNKLVNNYRGDDFNASFMIPNISSFGTTLFYDCQQDSSNQLLDLSQDESFVQLSITLLDSRGCQIQTNNNNNTNMGIQMSLSLY